MSYQKSQPDIWTGRVDPSGAVNTYYWHQVVQCKSLDEISPAKDNSVVFLGYQSDEGVRRNQGRVGAKDGPDAMRSAMSKFALHFDSEKYSLIDAGNVFTDGNNLESSQMKLAETVRELLSKGHFTILLGGGHEIAYGHYRGIRKYLGKGANIGIINLDAHFDLRPYPDGPHSGSPFRQVLDDCEQEGESFHYLPIGINPAGNQQVLFDVHKAAGQPLVLEREIDPLDLSPVTNQINAFATQVDHIYLTLDLDAISSAYAPAVSAPAAFGLSPDVVRQLIKAVFNTGKVISFDIAELNPEYDDGRTAKLAASFIYEVVTDMFGG